jgi:hypothetical protein
MAVASDQTRRDGEARVEFTEVKETVDRFRDAIRPVGEPGAV